MYILLNFGTAAWFGLPNNELTVGAGALVFFFEILLILLGIYLSPWLNHSLWKEPYVQPTPTPTPTPTLTPTPTPTPTPKGNSTPIPSPQPQPTTLHINTCNGHKAEANLRESPGGCIKGYIPNGAEFQLQARSCGEWYLVKSGDSYGWIHRCFVDGSN